MQETTNFINWYSQNYFNKEDKTYKDNLNTRKDVVVGSFYFRYKKITLVAQYVDGTLIICS